MPVPSKRQLAALAALSFPFVLAACSKSEAADPRELPPLVRAASAGPSRTSERSFTGVVVARVQSDLGFRVRGKVVERLVDAGETVKKGQALMRIDPDDLNLATVAQVNTVAAAKARAVQTAADEKRYADLVSAGAVSASAYDQAKAAAESARAMLAAAEAQAGVARNESGYAVLLADADGVVMDTLAEPGQVVAAGQTVVRLARSGPREAAISLPETVRPAIGSTASASVFGSDTDADAGPAKLRELSSSANPLTRTYEARFVLEGAAAKAPLGSTVTVKFAATTGVKGIDVPLSAIYDQGQGPGVWVIEGGANPVVNWRKVQLAGLTDETATIAAGLAASDRYVSLGAHMLHAGEAVRVAGIQAASK